MITIYDLARETGFSAPTISKALNGNGKLNPNTRQKILDAASKLGYKPNMAAKSLSTKHSQLIGIILEDTQLMRGFEHPLFGGMLNIFRREIESFGYDLLFLSKNFNGGMSYIDHCKYRNVDGILVVNPIEDDPEIKSLGKYGIPCVSTNEFIKGVCTVVSENEESGKLACQKLIDAGHSKIGFIGAPFKENSPASVERFKGFEACFTENGLVFDNKYREISDYWSERAGFDAAKRLFERCPETTAVFAVSDTLAFGAINYLESIGKKVFDDVSIIGFDDDNLVSPHSIILNTFRQNREEIAKTACRMLLDKIGGKENPAVVRIKTDYIEKGSVRKIN